jgi:bifunctional UDP-N-acetylglucosamine pyrophosphorylase / glucosamine-1-phosphate N-acetyltransferase
MMPLHIIILAAGQGTRMLSKTPKVLHQVGGKPMLQHVIHTALLLKPAQIHVIIGHGGEAIKKACAHLDVNWVTQDKQLGTGHAVLQALPHVPLKAQLLILSADVPLIQAETLSLLIAEQAKHQALALLVATLPDPFGLGRILRQASGHIVGIVEEKDASIEQRAINEIYSGICCGAAADFNRWLPALSPNNAQQEYYLTGIIAMAVSEALPIVSLSTLDSTEIQGVNNRAQLEQLERALQKRMALALMHAGVTLADAARIDIRGEIHCGADVFIDVNNVFIGEVSIGEGSNIEPNCVLKNVKIGSNCTIHANTVMETCTIGNDCEIGPFARIRPGTALSAHCKIGNFVETKNAVFGTHSKASHLSYLGDVTVGNDVNIGAGTITCNYDGANKHQTIIHDGAFIGSDTQLVAPVTIGEKATIGAGSTIRKDVPAGELTLTESRQKTLYGWVRPTKKAPEVSS